MAGIKPLAPTKGTTGETPDAGGTARLTHSLAGGAAELIMQPLAMSSAARSHTPSEGAEGDKLDHPVGAMGLWSPTWASVAAGRCSPLESAAAVARRRLAGFATPGCCGERLGNFGREDFVDGWLVGRTGWLVEADFEGVVVEDVGGRSHRSSWRAGPATCP